MPLLELTRFRGIMVALALASATTARAQATSPDAGIAVLNAVLTYRSVWMADSTRFDACTASAAFGRPRDFPTGIAAGLRGLLASEDTTCAGVTTLPASVQRVVRINRVTLSDTAATVFATVKIDDKFHSERFAVERRGSAWQVREVTVAGGMYAVGRLPRSEWAAGPPAEQLLIVIDGVVQPVRSGGTATDTSSLSAHLQPQDIESIEVLRDPEAEARFGTAGKNGAILIRRKHPAHPAPATL